MNQAAAESIILKPQPGPQEAFLSTPADIALFGGSAGPGKTWSLLVEPMRHLGVKDFGGVIFRRTRPQITNEGSLWDESMKIYALLGGIPRVGDLSWVWPDRVGMSFKGLENESDKLGWQGAQIPYIGFDELTHFTKSQFFYMVSRNRSTCGIRPYIRCTCNPDPDSWVLTFIEWWIDEAGDPIPERSGVIRWFVVEAGNVIWGDTVEQLREKHPHLFKANPDRAKSFTFIHATVHDNKILMEKDPGYLANLQALPPAERAALLDGNWRTRAKKGDAFQRSWVEVIESSDVPWARIRRTIRRWDRAATKTEEGKDPDWTAGAKIAQLDDGHYLVLDVERFREDSGENESRIKNTASQDGKKVAVRMGKDPGSAGVDVIYTYATRVLPGYDFVGVPETGPKPERFAPFSAACKNKLVKFVRGTWNAACFDELEALWGKGHDDQADALGGAYNDLNHTGMGLFDYLREEAEKAEQEKAKQSQDPGWWKQ